MENYLESIKQDPSENFGTRGGQPITHIILHCPVGTDAGALATLKKKGSNVSAHYLLQRNGIPVQLVQLQYAAWHAMHIPNLWSVGIEITDRYFIGNQLSRGCMGDPHWLTHEQLVSLVNLVSALMVKFNIPLSNVIGHNNPWLKQFGNNHTDPGPYFPWAGFQNMVKDKLSVKQPTTECIPVIATPKVNTPAEPPIIVADTTNCNESATAGCNARTCAPKPNWKPFQRRRGNFKR